LCNFSFRINFENVQDKSVQYRKTKTQRQKNTHTLRALKRLPTLPLFKRLPRIPNAELVNEIIQSKFQYYTPDISVVRKKMTDIMGMEEHRQIAHDLCYYASCSNVSCQQMSQKNKKSSLVQLSRILVDELDGHRPPAEYEDSDFERRYETEWPPLTAEYEEDSDLERRYEAEWDRVREE